MKLDQHTQQDLEIFATSTRDPGLFDHLDRTRTRGGREVLRRRFSQPLTTVSDIRAVQDCLRYITSNRSAFDTLPNDSLLVPLRRYLESRYVVLARNTGSAATLEAFWVRVRHHDMYVEAERGIRLVQQFLDGLEYLADAQPSAPPVLREIFNEMRRLLQSESMGMLSQRARLLWRWRDTLIQDHNARDRARAALLRMIELVHEIDALLSLADVTREKGYTYPELTDDPVGIEIAGLQHPFLEAPVPNNLRLTHGQRLLFLTGPNMAGKTTYLKTAGVIVLLAHVGMGVPAAHCRLSLVHRLITAIRTEDSLHSGISYFQAEARRVKHIAQPLAAGERCFVIVDELFRGTNVKDAFDASLEVIRALAGAANGVFLIASHLTELAAELERHEGVLLMRFEADIENAQLAFDYRVKAGVSNQRLGMRVLEQEGVLDVLRTIGGDAQEDRVLRP